MSTEGLNRNGNLYVFLFAGLFLLGSVYVGAYFAMGEYEQGEYGPNCHSRVFQYVALRELFGPLGWTEANLRGGMIVVAGPDYGDCYYSEWEW